MWFEGDNINLHLKGYVMGMKFVEGRACGRGRMSCGNKTTITYD